MVRRLRRWLYIGHRWIGIVTCLFFVMWFASGIVMMYVAFPGLTDGERLAALPDIAWDKVQLAPDRIMGIAGVTHYPRDLRLNMLSDEPVYRLTDWSGKRQVISARRRPHHRERHAEQALAVAQPTASPRLRNCSARSIATSGASPPVTIGCGRCFWSRSATPPVHNSTSRPAPARSCSTPRATERVWNWLGSIPHWIYPTILRQDGALWRDSGTVDIRYLHDRCRQRHLDRYPAACGCGGAIPATSVTPYRGWMAWHHVTGFFSVSFVLTWMFSGWLSLNPGNYFSPAT